MIIKGKKGKREHQPARDASLVDGAVHHPLQGWFTKNPTIHRREIKKGKWGLGKKINGKGSEFEKWSKLVRPCLFRAKRRGGQRRRLRFGKKGGQAESESTLYLKAAQKEDGKKRIRGKRNITLIPPWIGKKTHRTHIPKLPNEEEKGLRRTFRWEKVKGGNRQRGPTV